MKNLSRLCLGLTIVVLNASILVSGAGGGAGSLNTASSGSLEISDTDNTKMLHVGYPLVIECKMSEDKDEKLQDVKWYKNNTLINSNDENYKIVMENSTLIVPAAEKEDTGVYRCVDNLEREFQVNVIYLFYKKMPKSVTVLQGDKLSLVCDTEGIPIPSISWFKGSRDVEYALNSSHYTLMPNAKGTPNATFQIESAVYDDRAEYACFIHTALNTYNTSTIVRVKDMYAALWPFLGIVAEVFILCLIILIYEKKRAKADFEESDTDQPPETKDQADYNKDSVRQRK